MRYHRDFKILLILCVSWFKRILRMLRHLAVQGGVADMQIRHANPH
jgi:hypothetical protein